MANEETEIWELKENGKVVIWETANAELVTGKQKREMVMWETATGEMMTGTQ